MATPPQFAQLANYCRMGMYMPFENMPSTAAGFATWVANLEAFLGTRLEVLSLGLPNDMGNPTSTLQRLANSPQAVVWAMPGTVNGTSGSGSLQLLNAGSYDSLIDATAAAFVAVRGGGAANSNHGEDTCRSMWEFDATNYGWALGKVVSGHTQTNADIAAGFDRIHTRMRAGGYTGRLVINGLVDPITVFNMLTRPDLVDGIDLDAYNYTGVSGRTDEDLIWSAEMLPRLNNIAAFCRANGKRMGFPECGVEITNNPWHSGPTGTYWTHMHQFCLDNADVMTYITGPFNQNLPGGGAATTADDALFYCGTPAGTTPTDIAHLGSLHSVSQTAAWVGTPSPLHSAELANFLAVMKAGSMQITPQPPVPAQTLPIPLGVRSNHRGQVHLFG